MIPNELDEKTITDIATDVCCATLSIAILNLCFRNMVQMVFDFALKIGS